MFQPDLFSQDVCASRAGPVADRRALCMTYRPKPKPAPDTAVDGDPLDLPAIVERIARISRRPRYTFMVLHLIARAAGRSGSAGPYVDDNGGAVPIRDWLSGALLPMAQRDVRRLAVVDEVRDELARNGLLSADESVAEQQVLQALGKRLIHSGRTNVSRAVSDLVRAGLLHRHYQGYRVDHCNRGAQREAVYTISPAVQAALGQGG